jgi:ectoine utilization protein EutC
MAISILNETDLRNIIRMDQESLTAVEEGFAKLSAGLAEVPPILQLMVPENNGELDVKTAYIKGMDSFAVKIAAGFLNNHEIGLSTGSGMMILINSVTGFPKAILLDNGYLTDVRTGLAGAIAAKYLAPEHVKIAGVIGSGIQSRFQIEALYLVRKFLRLLVFGIIPEDVQIYAEEMRQKLGVEVFIADSYEQVVRESQVVVTTTPSTKAFIKSNWLHAGLHITCMGADSANKQEIFSDVFKHVDRIVCDNKAQCLRLGELSHAINDGIINSTTDITEIGELILGMKPGRKNVDEVTICDLTGVGVQDTAIARLAYHKACEKSLGIHI